MTENFFIVEIKNKLSNDHFISLRNLYLPIVGNKAINLFSILYDHNTLYDKSYFEIKDILKTMRINSNEFKIAKSKLEAIGLIRTFTKSTDNHFIFLLNSPLKPIDFKKNSLLFNACKKQVGDEVIERIFFNLNEKIINKDEFKETTVKFHDVFEDNKKYLENTIEIPIESFSNTDDALKGSVPSQFIHFLTNQKIIPSQLSMIQRISNSGLPSQSLNEIIKYSFEINGRIISNHIEVIANDMISKRIIQWKDISLELERARNNSKSQSSLFNINDESIPVKEESSDSSLKWDDIFNSLGGDL